MLSKMGHGMFIGLFLGLGIVILSVIAVFAWLVWVYIL